MAILRKFYVAVALGALLVAALALAGAAITGPRLAQALSGRAETAITQAGGAPVTARFASASGQPSRHPILSGGEGLDEATRDRVAKAVAAIQGVGGIRWADGTAFAESSTAPAEPLHCQEDVEALLRARTIRFEEGSARIDAASRELVDEVAGALRPCLGSIIAITGHTDASGPEAGNLALSRERAEAVEAALVARGIPADGLRSRGRGSRAPVEGLEPADPANRRIEFSVIATQPIRPTPVDTPGPR
jgi:OOP family OmpA-OmpF porin